MTHPWIRVGEKAKLMRIQRLLHAANNNAILVLVGFETDDVKVKEANYLPTISGI